MNNREFELPARFVRPTLYALFCLSGFTGLIYESIWTHYLKLFLGHAAYAQVLVLGIFMGGMALGAALASHYSLRFKHLLLGYALVEAIIGLFALVFHSAFVHSTEFAYLNLIPQLTDPMQVEMVKWGLAGALILPQSVLLGLTFPLMSGGIVRAFPNTPGRSLAVLYFSNSIGAAAGVLVSGFFLIQFVGLPGTIFTAGLLNLLVALFVWLLSKTLTCPSRPTISATSQSNAPNRYRAFLMLAALTGAASFFYEIGWIRMLSMVLGSSTHAFELMLSAFILGLALGGLWVRRSIDNLSNPVQTLGWIQIAMGIFALATLGLYGATFDLMSFMMTGLAKTQNGYTIFNFTSHAVALFVMLPATICAGMTLPIITYYLLKTGHGERVIGSVYAANTIGAIIAIALAVQLVMPLFGVKYLILIGGAIDMTLGLLLIRSKRSFANHWQTAMAFALCIAVGFGTWFFAELDLNKMSSGVFRHGMAKLEDRNILYAKDGKTASIHVADTNGVRAISTNGKPDAGISLSGEITSDEPTMLLLGALPLAIAQNARDVAVIGMGSGMTSHVVLNDPAIESVDTIEIEKAIIEGAQTFGDKVSNTFNDPRSHIHIEDAKSYFTNRNKKYDVIISEPSNPWVSGVAGLFSEEFYRLIQRHVAEGGLFVQWLHLYEISTPLVATVMGALSPHFTDYAVYMVSNLDIVVVAHKNTAAVPPSDRIFHLPSFDALLKSMKIHSVDDLRIRQIGTKSVLDPFFKSYGMPANSDFYPALDLHAVRTRYLGLNALNILELRTTAIPLFEVLQQEAPGMGITALNEPLHNPLAQNYYNAQQAMQYYKMRKADQIDVNFVIDSTMIITIEDVRTLRTLCKPVLLEQIWLPALHNLFHSLMPFIAAQDMDILWQDIATAPCPDAIPESVQQWINFYQSVSQRDFAAILETAHKLLPEGTIEFSARHEHLIQAAMLAHYVQGNFKQALSLFDRYQHRNKFSVATRLLHQLSTQNLATNTADAATDQ